MNAVNLKCARINLGRKMPEIDFDSTNVYLCSLYFNNNLSRIKEY